MLSVGFGKYKFEYFLAVILSLSIPLQFDYFFSGSSRYIPLRVIFSLFLVYFFYKLFKRESIRIFPLFCFFLISTVFSLFVLFWVFLSTSVSLGNEYVNALYIISLVFLVANVFPKLSLDQLSKSMLIFILVSTVALTFEVVIRIYYPALDVHGLDNLDSIYRVHSMDFNLLEFFMRGNFYAYKYSSIMFYDSNYVGLYALFLIVILFFYKFNIKSNMFINFIIFLNVIFVFLSFSRAAVLVLPFVFYMQAIYLTLKYKKYALLSVLLLALTFIVFLFSYYVFQYIKTDDSFITKVNIALSVLDGEKQEGVIRFLFGYGFVGGGYIYSYEEGQFAHALIPLLLGQIGFLGSVIYIMFLLYLTWLAGWYGFLILVVLIIPGFSLADPWQISYYYGFFLFYYYLKLKKSAVNSASKAL